MKFVGEAHVRSRFIAVLSMSVLAWVSGCSFAGESSRPDPAAQNNVRCLLDYHPGHAGADGSDLVFAAWSSPYREENFNLSLPDLAVHGLFAPGRHLVSDLIVEGATCTARPWKRGFRLPAIPKAEKFLVCRRHRAEEVSFRVTTKWGECTREVPAGELEPRPDPWFSRWLELNGLAYPGGSGRSSKPDSGGGKGR